MRVCTGVPSGRPRRSTAVALFCLAVALAGAVAATGARPAWALSGRVATGSFQSTALHGRIHYSIYLPAGYGTSNARYPVVYFLHGLPSSPTAYRSITWVARAVEQSGRNAIVVGAQGSRSGDSDPEWHDWGPGRNWETATASELVAAIDSRYRTIPTRDGRAIIGYSAGGYGATLIGFHRPGEYSVIQSWSGYFEPTNPSGTAVLNLGSARANTLANMHFLIPSLQHRLGAYFRRVFFDFYVGRSDGRFFQDNVRLHRELVASHVPNVFYRSYAGDHGAGLWHTHAADWLQMALSHLARS